MSVEPPAPPEPAEPGASDAVEVLTHRLERLQEVARRLIGAETAAAVADVIMTVVDTPVPATSRGLWLTSSVDGALHLVEHRGFHPETARRFERIAPDDALPGAQAWRERRTVVSTSRPRAEAAYPGLRHVERSAEGFLAVPLLLEDACLGVLGLGYEQEPPAGDVAFLEAVAGQTAQALDRVRLVDRHRRRRAELEFLADLTDQALNASDHRDLMHRVTSAAVPMLGDWCALTFLPIEGGPAQVAVAHVDPSMVEWAEALQARHPFDPDAETGPAAVIRTGETEYVPDVTEEVVDDAVQRSSMHPDEARDVVATLRPSSAITVALRTKRRTVGAMQFVCAESGRHYTDEDVDLAEAVAGRLAEPLDNAWVTDQERHMSVAFQRTLLPPRLPSIPGVEAAAGYWPAGTAEVGGDFYDVFQIGADTWSIVIGDACGTGPDSAALTSIARHTIRAAARHGRTHAEVLEWTNEAILKSDRDLFMTVCYSTLSRHGGRWRLVTANAGHPLPIALGARATPIAGPGTLLGTFPTIRTTTVEHDLAPGDAVLFYTDGVTDLPPPFGLTPDELLAEVVALPDRSSATAIVNGVRRSIIRRVPDTARIDDVALVVIRVDD